MTVTDHNTPYVTIAQTPIDSPQHSTNLDRMGAGFIHFKLTDRFNILYRKKATASGNFV